MNDFDNNQNGQQNDENGQNDSPFGGRSPFIWDGRQQGPNKKNRKTGTFMAVAIVCLLLTAAICVPTIMYTMKYDGSPSAESGNADTSSGSQSQAGVLPDESSREEISYEISETVTVTDSPYFEESVLTELYETCKGSCATIYVTYGSQVNGYAIGSGFVLTEDGYIATNQHVVDGGADFKVIFYDGTEYEAELVGEDAMRDLAVLKINATGLNALEIGDSDALSIGQTTIAIGTPYDLALAGTMTMGIISGVNREIEFTNDYGTVVKTMRLIQTDTAINPGNSGGPLINLAGQVVGINSHKLTGQYEGMGFAIPINYAVEIFNQLIQYGEVVQEPENDFVTANPRLGVTVYNLQTGLNTFRIRPECDYPAEGILVSSVEADTAAYRAGLEVYDIITEFDGEPITCVQDLTAVLAKYKAGDTVSMTVFSFSNNFTSGEYKTLTFVLDSVV